MQKRLISIIPGLILVICVGTLVYSTKKPMILPSEDITENETTISGNATTNKTTAPVKTSPVSNVKKYESDDDDEDERRGSTTTSPIVTPPTATQTTPQTGTSTGGITLATIAKHSSRTSCWSAINGSVYDLTSWIPNHPGGEQTILSLCGIDGSNGYNGQHGGSSKPARILGGFKIGTLAK